MRCRPRRHEDAAGGHPMSKPSDNAMSRRGFVQFLARGTGVVVAVGAAWKAGAA